MRYNIKNNFNDLIFEFSTNNRTDGHSDYDFQLI